MAPLKALTIEWLLEYTRIKMKVGSHTVEGGDFISESLSYLLITVYELHPNPFPIFLTGLDIDLDVTANLAQKIYLADYRHER